MVSQAVFKAVFKPKFLFHDRAPVQFRLGEEGRKGLRDTFPAIVAPDGRSDGGTDGNGMRGEERIATAERS